MNNGKNINEKRMELLFTDLVYELRKFSDSVDENSEDPDTFFLKVFLDNMEKYWMVYDILEDKESKETFLYLIKNRIMNAIAKTQFAGIYPFRKICSYHKDNESIAIDKVDEDLYKCNDYIIEAPKRLIHHAWIREEYNYMNKCLPEPGDVVISGGAYYGETTIWFADKVGEKGRVYSFEPSTDNLVILEQNIERNNLQENVQVVKKLLWNSSGRMRFLQQGIGTGNCVSNLDVVRFHGDEEKTYIDVETIDIDTFVKEKRIGRIDFIKMDIEGSEMAALKGAEYTIKTMKPKLAISIYHLPADMYKIALYIKSVVPEYVFNIAHKNPDNFMETILFAYIK